MGELVATGFSFEFDWLESGASSQPIRYHLCLSDMANTFTNLGFRCPLQNRCFLGFRDIVSEAFREARINSEQFFF